MTHVRGYLKLKFKQQAYQSDAVKAVVDCFAGQPKSAGFRYAIDRGWGQLHEIPDQLGIIRHLTKWAERITTPAERCRFLARE